MINEEINQLDIKIKEYYNLINNNLEKRIIALNNPLKHKAIKIINNYNEIDLVIKNKITKFNKPKPNLPKINLDNNLINKTKQNNSKTDIKILNPDNNIETIYSYQNETNNNKEKKKL